MPFDKPLRPEAAHDALVFTTLRPTLIHIADSPRYSHPPLGRRVYLTSYDELYTTLPVTQPVMPRRFLGPIPFWEYLRIKS